MDNEANGAQPARPRLNLKPRDPAVAEKLEAQRLEALAAKNPFGAAKPRERVIAEREGKSERDILVEEVKKDKLHLRLNASQLEEKRAIEAALKQAQELLTAEEDVSKHDALKAGVTACQGELDLLMERFAKATLETALSGEAPRVSALRRQQAEQAMVAPPAVAPPPPGQYNQRYNPTQQYAGPGQRGGYAPRGGLPEGAYNGRGGGGGGSYAPRGGRAGYEAGYAPQRGGGRGLPEWAREEYGQPAGGRGGGYEQYSPGGGGAAAGGGGGFSGYRPASGAATYNDSSDAGFYDQPSGGGGARGRGGRGRGRGGRDAYGGGGGGPQFYESLPAGGYPGAGTGRGVGGEIEFDTFGGQDRY